ncbi:MAG TPA: GAF domain-containing protein, partial [Bacteroidota bacterium]
MKFGFRKFRQVRATLGPVEQAQIVASTAVVVAMVTIILVRVFSGYSLDWWDFVSVTIVGIFGFMIVFFTLKYGRQLEEQKQELLSLKTFAEAINQSTEVQFLLQNALREVSQLLDVEYGWIYHVENGKLVLKASEQTGGAGFYIIEPNTSVEELSVEWVRTARIQIRPKRRKGKTFDSWHFPDIAAWASVPILMKDTFQGMIVVASKDRNAFDKKQLDLMSAFANQIGVAMENVGLIDRLRKSEERYMDLFEHSPDMYHIVNRDGMIVSCNQTEANRLGYRKEEMVSVDLQNLSCRIPRYGERIAENDFCKQPGDEGVGGTDGHEGGRADRRQREHLGHRGRNGEAVPDARGCARHHGKETTRGENLPRAADRQYREPGGWCGARFQQYPHVDPRLH